MKSAGLIILVLLLAGCASRSGVKVWWNPTTWGTNRAAVVDELHAKADINDAEMIRLAQIENEKTLELIKAIQEKSRAVEQALRTATNAKLLLDTANGPISMQELTELRDTVEKLLSANEALRAEGEKAQERAEAAAAVLTQRSAKLKTAINAATDKLTASYERERALANTVRNFWFLAGAIVLVFVGGNLLSIAARFFPGLSGAARIVNGIATPALAFAEARATDGLKKLGHALTAARETMGEEAEKAVAFIDEKLDADHKLIVHKAAETAPRA